MMQLKNIFTIVLSYTLPILSPQKIVVKIYATLCRNLATFCYILAQNRLMSSVQNFGHTSWSKIC